MGVAKSTLSEALGSLEERSLIARNGSGILRTSQGTAAMSNGSVLEREPLRRLLEHLSEDERRRAIDGLELLAGAGRKVNEYVD
jgi:DNA-binding MarR family transcriptional regulator